MHPETGASAGDYEAALHGAALYDHTSRGLIQVTGNDRAAWLNNLVTNVIKTLEPGSGNYAFAANVKGRIVFDLNMLVLPDALWLDIDRRFIATALKHLDRYIITEDVQLQDRSDDFARLALLGPQAIQIADALGVTDAASLPQLASRPATLVQKNRLLVRHDLAGVFGAELYVESADREEVAGRLLDIGRPVGLRCVSQAAVEALRIEAGIPAPVAEINDDILPAETQQLDRAVSFHKGCYLGQEVVERMRAHNVLARRLVGVTLAGPVAPPVPLLAADVEVGRVTSACESPAVGGWIGLGYLKVAHATPGSVLAVGGAGPVQATVSKLPFREGET